ncbi:vegetative cell wall protein gp1-like [Zingiber officinale]|uniref:vegetative cell wall protein gp1-like n=1 Tax=Zingiber officinale TaxID=94328 RepID=UPI001C4BF585|nr:vegetative cell wall protein gp1-like [Zingiber officinale]
MAAAAESSLAASSGRKSQTVEAWGTDGLSEGRSRRPRRRTRWNGCCPRLTSSFLLDARHRIIRDQIFWTTYPWSLPGPHMLYTIPLTLYDPSHVQNACTRPRTEALASPPLPQPPASPAASLHVVSLSRPLRPPSNVISLQRPPAGIASIPWPPASAPDLLPTTSRGPLPRPPPATSLQRPPRPPSSRDLQRPPPAPSAASLLPRSPAATSRDLPLATSSNLQQPPAASLPGTVWKKARTF